MSRQDRFTTPSSPLTPLTSTPTTPTILQSIERDLSPSVDRGQHKGSPLASHQFDIGAPHPDQPIPENQRDLIYEADQAELNRRFHRSSAPTPDLLPAEQLGNEVRAEAQAQQARFDSAINALIEAVSEGLEAEDSEEEEIDPKTSISTPHINRRQFQSHTAPAPDLTEGYNLLNTLYGPAEERRQKRSADRVSASYHERTPIRKSSGRPIRVRNISVKGKESQASHQKKQVSKSPKPKSSSKTPSPKKEEKACKNQAGPVTEASKSILKTSTEAAIDDILAANTSKKRKVKFEEDEEPAQKKVKEARSFLRRGAKKRSAEPDAPEPIQEEAKVERKIVILKIPSPTTKVKLSEAEEAIAATPESIAIEENNSTGKEAESAAQPATEPPKAAKKTAKSASKIKEIKGKAKKIALPKTSKKVKASTVDNKPAGAVNIDDKPQINNDSEAVTDDTLDKIEVIPKKPDEMASARIIPKEAPKGADNIKASPKKAAPTKVAKATATKAQPKPAKAAASKNAAPRKRKADEIEDKKVPAKKVAASAKKLKVINTAPKDRLKVFVFGEGGNGELGLGAKGNVIDVKRPRLNPFLLPANVGVVQLATGGMHAAALTHDNRILTWGVNDQGTLGRETKSADQTRDMDADSNDSDDESDTGLNPLESQPKEIDMDTVPAGTTWTKLALGDSVTFAITDTGLVYGCGTFRSNDGILGFSSDGNIEAKMVQVAGLKNIVDITCGSNHALALDDKGAVFAWGSGQQSQLGRRIVERTRLHGLKPTPVAFPRSKIQAIGNGNYHSFAIDTRGEVWAWGLNSFGETGIDYLIGESEAVVVRPEKVPALSGKDVVSISGGAHHSVALTRDGTTLVFGRCDSAQSGLDLATVTKDAIVSDEKGVARLVSRPLPLTDLPAAAAFAVGTDSNIVVARSGRAYSWGFSTNYQTGQGTTDDIARPTLIDNTATREEKLVWAGAGGQYGMLASRAAET